MEKIPTEEQSIEQQRSRIISLDELQEGDLVRYSPDEGKTYIYAKCGPKEKDHSGKKDLVNIQEVGGDWSLGVGEDTLKEHIFEKADESEMEQQKS